MFVVIVKWVRKLAPVFFILPVLFFLLFYFYPLGAILGESLAPGGELALGPVQDLLRQSYFLNILWFTFWQASLSTLLVLVLALPGAYVFARYRFRGKRTIRAFSLLPFVLPTVVVANAFLALLGPRGTINSWFIAWLNLEKPPIQLQYSLWMILLAHIFFNYSVAMRIISDAWQNLSPDLGDAAQMLGARPGKVFWQVTFPLLWPSIGAAAVLVFIFCFTSFGVILILGGPRFATLEVEIYRQTVNLFNLPAAAALSIIQIVFTFFFLWFYTRTQSKRNFYINLVSSKSIEIPVKTVKDYLVVYGNLLLILILLGLPLLALVGRSLSGTNGFTTRFYTELFVNRQNSLFFVPPSEAILNSIGFAVITLFLAVGLGFISTTLLTRKDRKKGSSTSPKQRLGRITQRILDPLFMLPLATSAVTLGFGYIIALNKPPLNLRQSLILVPIAHTLVAIPIVIRTLLPAVRRINPRLQEAAAMLGAQEHEVWLHVDWPLIRRAILIGAVFAFTISMGEFGATVFIARPQTPTMPIAIYRFLGQPGALNYGQALAMSTLLMLVCALGFVMIERFRLGAEGEF